MLKKKLDNFDKCLGKDSKRLGLYDTRKICLVDPNIYCSKRYEDKKYKNKDKKLIFASID